MDNLYNLPKTISKRSSERPIGVRPASFEPGRKYMWLYSNTYPSAVVQKFVKFLQYDTCPAFVIVLDSTGKIVRCPRDELFLL